MRRIWSIRTQTALVFAVAAMALAVAVVAFSNVMTARSLEQRLVHDGSPFDGAPGAGGPALSQEQWDAGGQGVRDLDASDATGVVVVTTETQWQWSAVAIAGAGVVAGWLGWALSRRVLRPIDRITATANRISASSLHERVDLDGPDDELRRLSRTIDDLLDRLQAAFESQRRFVAQASHELRTPLAVQRSTLQIALTDDAAPDDVRAARDELLDQNRRTEHLVESLLVLADADRGLAGRTEQLDLDAVAAEVMASCAAEARRAGVRLRLSGTASAALRGESTLVRQVLLNLVDNAIEYNAPEGFVAVTLSDTTVTVENSGPVVPAAQVAGLVEPFRRCGGGTRRHSGLGLSIVTAVVRAHGWTLDIAARDGGGLVVRVFVDRD